MLCAQSLYWSGSGWLPLGLAAALALTALLRPGAAVLLLAGLGPLAVVIFVLTRSDPVSVRYEEAVVLAVLAGWSLRRAFTPPRETAAAGFRWAILLLLALTTSSGLVVLAGASAADPGTSLPVFADQILRTEYLLGHTILFPPMLLIEGLALALLLADWCAQRDDRRAAVLRMMVVGAAAAGTLNVLRLVVAAAAMEAPWSALVRLLLNQRVSVQYGDLNAAGSYFAMILLVALGLARGWRWAGLSAALLGAGLWVSGSRSAMAAAAVVGAGLAARQLWGRTARPFLLLFAVAVLLLSAGAFAWSWYPEGRNAPWREATGYRVPLARAALSLAATAPLFGVGVGSFYTRVEPYIGWRENAHNNLLQLAAELGVPALLLFLTAVAVALRAAWIRAGEARLAAALLAALTAYLLTTLTGHPLLVPATAYPFWMILGVTVSLAPGHVIPRRRAVGAAVVLLLVALTLPVRMAEAARNADLEHRSVGMSSWQHAPDGRRYRWAGGRSTFCVSAEAAVVRVPLRHAAAEPERLEVRILIDGREADRVLLEAGADWRVVQLRLPNRRNRSFFSVDLEIMVPGSNEPLVFGVTAEGGLLAVGQPEVVVRP